MVENKRLTVSVEEMAHMIGVSRSKAYELARSDGFPSVRVGGRIVVPVRELEDWLASQVKKGQQHGQSA